MSKPARSVFCFGIYLGLLGAWLVSFPNPLLTTFGFPSTNEVWIRIVGALALVLAFFYVEFARKEMKGAFYLTVYGRSAMLIFYATFVWRGYVAPVIILFGLVDLLGALWTAAALRSD